MHQCVSDYVEEAAKLVASFLQLVINDLCHGVRRNLQHLRQKIFENSGWFKIQLINMVKSDRWQKPNNLMIYICGQNKPSTKP
jgi:hypothetical protein